MSQTQIQKLIPKLRYNVHKRRRLSQPEGPKGRHDKIRKIVTALFKYERLETLYSYGDESRGYAERLISDAIKYGDCHTKTMEMASYWLTEKQLVHKLFKVLAPRYQNYPFSYTKLWRAPINYPNHGRPLCVLELRENIYPPLGPDKTNNKNLIHNVLLSAAKEAYAKEKALKLKKFEIDLKSKLTETNAKLNVEKNSERVKMSEVDLLEKEENKTDEESIKSSDEGQKTAEEKNSLKESRLIVEEAIKMAEAGRVDSSKFECEEEIKEIKKNESEQIEQQSKREKQEKTKIESQILNYEENKQVDREESVKFEIIESKPTDHHENKKENKKEHKGLSHSEQRERRFLEGRSLKRSVASVDLSGIRDHNLNPDSEVSNNVKEEKRDKSEEEKKKK